MLTRLVLTVVLWSSVAVATVLCASGVLLSAPFAILLGDKQRHSLHVFGIIWGRVALGMFPGWKVTVTGKENLAPKNTPAVYVANHLSQADILGALYLGMRFRFLSKASVFKVPFMGWAMKLIGYVGVQRGNKHSHEKIMFELKKHLENNTPVFFFPEGTRSPDGILRDFKSGAFRLAEATGAPIIPITFIGTNKLLPKGSFIPHSADIRIIVHPPIAPKGKTEHELMLATRKVIREALPPEQQGHI